MYEAGTNNWPRSAEAHLRHNGELIPYPVVEGSLINKTPLTPFSPAVQTGDDSRVVDRRLSVFVWNDFTGGLGVRTAEERRGITTYHKGSLDSRNKNVLVLPPAPVYKATVPGGVTFTSPVRASHMYRPGGGNNALLWSENLSSAYLYDAGTNAITNKAIGSVKAFARFAGAYYALTDNGTDQILQRSTDGGANWAAAWTSGAVNPVGLTEFDLRLWTIDSVTLRPYFSFDGTTWTQHAARALPLHPGEKVRQLFSWRTPDGQQQTLYLLTTGLRIFALNPIADEWHVFEDLEGVFDHAAPQIHIWRRNDEMYMNLWDTNDPNFLVMHSNGGTMDEVGPSAKGGFAATSTARSISHIGGSIHDLLAFCDYESAAAPGAVLSMNELGGWHPIIDARQLSGVDKTLVGGGYHNQFLYALTRNGDFYVMNLRDRKELHPLADGSRYANGEHYLESAEYDLGLSNMWKVGAYFVIDTLLADGSHGIPPGASLRLEYRVDGGTWLQLPLLGEQKSDPVGLLTNLSLRAGSFAWPVVQKLPDGVTQNGVAFKNIQWRVYEARTPGGTSPAIVEISLYYTIWQEPRYAYQFALDLTEETFETRFPGGFYGRDREELQRILEAIIRQKGYTEVLFGFEPWQENPRAVDLLAASRVEANTGGAVYSVSVRDLSANEL